MFVVMLIADDWFKKVSQGIECTHIKLVELDGKDYGLEITCEPEDAPKGAKPLVHKLHDEESYGRAA